LFCSLACRFASAMATVSIIVVRQRTLFCKGDLASRLVRLVCRLVGSDARIKRGVETGTRILDIDQHLTRTGQLYLSTVSG
jgi:hypothetical protein